MTTAETAQPKTAHLCDYCSLPLPAPTQPAADDPAFCCVGCKIAASLAGERGEEGATRAMVTRLGLAIFFSMNVMAFTMALWSQEWNGELSAAALVTFDLLRYGCLFFSLPVLLLLGGPLASNVVEELRSRRITTDLLIAAGVAAAYAYSLVTVFTGSGHVYFEVGCMVLTTLTLGRYLEATGKLKTTQALRDLENLLPDNVRIVADDTEKMVPSSDVRVGNVLRILPGERIPVDGEICSGIATIDEHVVTGESEPVAKELGAKVFSGSLNLDGDIRVVAAAPAGESALRKLIDNVVAAASGQGRYSRLADRITHWFLPAIFVIALSTLSFYWYRDSLPVGIMTALAVVLIACPCALGLATPMALWSAVGRASRHGILFHDGDCLSRLAEIDLVCFDKTGTLTRGEPKLAAAYLNARADDDLALTLAGQLAGATTHPLARAIREAVGEPRHDAKLQHPTTVPGRGVRAEHAQQGKVYFGSLRLVEEAGIETHSPAERAGLAAAREGSSGTRFVTREMVCHNQSADRGLPAAERELDSLLDEHNDSSLVALAYAGQIQALFFFEEHIREGAAESITALREAGLEVTVLTGDRKSRANSLANQLGVAAIAELLPDQKLAHIEQWKKSGRKVLMIGDGLNDGPALAAAHVGVALGCGADLSRELADVCLLSNELTRIPEILELGRSTVRTIRWNLLWAFGYNAVGVALAAAGVLHPIFAAAAMVGSSVLVVSNSLRLAGSGEPARPADPIVENISGTQQSNPKWKEETERDLTPAGSVT